MKLKLNWPAILETSLPVIVFFGVIIVGMETSRFFEWRNNPPKIKQEIQDHKTNGAVSLEIPLESLSANDITWARRQKYNLSTNSYIGVSGKIDCLVISWKE